MTLSEGVNGSSLLVAHRRCNNPTDHCLPLIMNRRNSHLETVFLKPSVVMSTFRNGTHRLLLISMFSRFI